MSLSQRQWHDRRYILNRGCHKRRSAGAVQRREKPTGNGWGEKICAQTAGWIRQHDTQQPTSGNYMAPIRILTGTGSWWSNMRIYLNSIGSDYPRTLANAHAPFQGSKGRPTPEADRGITSTGCNGGTSYIYWSSTPRCTRTVRGAVQGYGVVSDWLLFWWVLFSIYQTTTVFKRVLFSIYQSTTLLKRLLFSIYQTTTPFKRLLFSIYQTTTIFKIVLF